MPPKSDLLAGTLEMLVLRTLSTQSMHGYAIAQHLASAFSKAMRIPARRSSADR